MGAQAANESVARMWMAALGAPAQQRHRRQAELHGQRRPQKRRGDAGQQHAEAPGQADRTVGHQAQQQAGATQAAVQIRADQAQAEADLQTALERN